MKMTSPIAALFFTVLMTQNTLAQQLICDEDITNVVISEHTNQVIRRTWTDNARTSNDFIHSANNYFYFSTEGRQIRTNLRFAYMNTFPSTETVYMPICNEVGQCATASVRAEIVYTNLGIWQIPSSVSGWFIEVRMFNGETRTFRWALEASVPGLVTPVQPPPGGIQDDRCRDNNGEIRSDQPGDWSNEGGGNPDGYDESFWDGYWSDWEESYNTPVCWADFSNPYETTVICPP